MFGFSEQLLLSEGGFLHFEEVSRCWMQDTKDGAALVRCLFRSRSDLSMTNAFTIICFFQYVSFKLDFLTLFLISFSTHPNFQLSKCPRKLYHQPETGTAWYWNGLPEVGATIGRDGCSLLFRTLQQMELQLDAKKMHANLNLKPRGRSEKLRRRSLDEDF